MDSHNVALAGVLTVMSAVALGCSNGDENSGTTSDSLPAADAATDANRFVFDTGPYTVPAGSEHYLCITKTVDEDLYIDKFWHDGAPTVHHLVMVQTLAPEPEGSFECDVFFKTTWIPLFAAGTASAELSVPAGSSFAIPKGTQLLVQLHLLNATDSDVSGDIEINMHKTAKTDSLAGIFGLGTTVISLPPGQKSSVHNDCVINEDVNAFAVFPHMHTHGMSLTYESGSDADHLVKQYEINPWDFGEQFIAPMPLTIHAGDLTRVTCNYDNPTNGPINFGESTLDEMCFFTLFRTEYQGLNGCVDLSGWTALGGDGGTPTSDAGR
jgi:hypothetical protein